MTTAEQERAPSGRPDVRTPSKELQVVARNFKQGYKYRRTGGGHFVVVDRHGKDVMFGDRPLTVGGNPSQASIQKHIRQLDEAQVLRGTKTRPMDDALKAKRDEAIRKTAQEVHERRHEETKAVRDRFVAIFDRMQGLQVPGLANDLGRVASLFVRGTPNAPTPDLLGQSALRSLVNGAPADRRYVEIWARVADALEASGGGVVGEWYNLVREARGLPADTVQLRLPTDAQDEWPFRVELLPLDTLLVDESYQRPPGWAFVRREAARFDPSLVGTIDVAQRSPSSFAILDGQQRTEIVRLIGKTTIWASIYVGLDLQSEARFFLHKNANRKNMHPYYTFRAEVASGDPDANAIETIVAKNGYVLAIGAPTIDGSNLHHIAAIQAVKKVYSWKLDSDGRDALDPTLAILSQSTIGREEGQSAMMIRGLGATLMEARDFDEDRMTDAVAALGPTLILGQARDLKRNHGNLTSEQAISRVILRQYGSRNGGRKRRAA